MLKVHFSVSDPSLQYPRTRREYRPPPPNLNLVRREPFLLPPGEMSNLNLAQLNVLASVIFCDNPLFRSPFKLYGSIAPTPRKRAVFKHAFDLRRIHSWPYVASLKHWKPFSFYRTDTQNLLSFIFATWWCNPFNLMMVWFKAWNFKGLRQKVAKI